MKIFLLILAVLAFHFVSRAQLKADAGIDTVWCSPNSSANGPTLGGHPTASLGTPPYTYLWSMINWPYNAPSLLDDVTSDQPTLKMKTPSWIDSAFFEVLVSDANGQKARDTVKVYCTNWICPLGVSDNVIYKNASDTVSLVAYECSSLYWPNIFLYWTPGQYLIDSSVRAARCWTPYSQQYTAYYKNQIGCVTTDICYVQVNNTGVGKQPIFADAVSIFPNPITADSKLVCASDWLGGTVTISSVEGKCLGAMRIDHLETSLGSWFELTKGIYFYRAVSSKGEVTSGKFLVE